MKPFYTLIFVTTLSLNLLAQGPCREVVGYYPGWQWYDRNKLVKPSSIDYSKYTILQYAFMNMDADGNLVITDPWGDKNILLGDINWGTAPAGYDTEYDLGNTDYHIPNTNLSYYAHLNDVKLLMSIGGWTLSGHFPGIAADATRRATFSADCAYICELYGLDGIDIDWEYPADDVQEANFTLLLQDIRSALDAKEIELNRELMLTAAVSASQTNMEHVDWPAVSQILDIINLMSYDFYGTWDPLLSHNSPLFYPGVGDADFTCSAAVQTLLTQYNIPSGKLTMGIPFYGRSQLSASVPQLFGTGNGSADYAHFGIDDGTPLYYNVLLQMSDFNVYWDDLGQVPYMTSATNNSFVSYDNESSVEAKSQYIIDQNLRGAIIWEITGDYLETSPGSGVISGTPLADKINEVFCQSPEFVAEDAYKIHLYPNPATSFIQIQSDDIAGKSISIHDVSGQQVLSLLCSANNMQIDLKGLASGYYLLVADDIRTYFVVR